MCTITDHGHRSQIEWLRGATRSTGILFPTLQFAVFFLAVFALAWFARPRPLAWKLLLLCASLVFYLGWGWRGLAVLVASTVVNHALGWLMGARPAQTSPRQTARRRALLALGVTLNLAALAWFKFYGFFITILDETLRALGVPAALPYLEIVAPVGISFLTFRAISYLVDVYRGTLTPAGLLDVALLTSLFPFVAAGPIVRGGELFPQLEPAKHPLRIDATPAFTLFLLGLFKKLVIADFLARTLVDPVFATPGRYGSLDVLAAVLGYAVQIYCDFSGYIDMALAVALLLGIRLPPNFDAPYTATSPRDFWRRWHMTLSRFLRDYLYIPLGGSGGSRAATCRNLIITMVLAGLWHGAAWTFIVWGAVHGLALALEHLHAGDAREVGVPRHRAVARAATFAFVTLAWIPFRADSLTSAGRVLTRLVVAWDQPGVLVGGWTLLALALGIGMQYLPRRVGDRFTTALSRLNPVVQGIVLAAILFGIDAFGPQGIAQFIYFQF